MINSELKIKLSDSETHDYLKEAQRTNCKHLYSYDTAKRLFGVVVENRCLLQAPCKICNKIVLNYEPDERIQEIVDTILKSGLYECPDQHYGLEPSNFICETFVNEENKDSVLSFVNNFYQEHSLKNLHLEIKEGSYKCAFNFYTNQDLESFKANAFFSKAEITRELRGPNLVFLEITINNSSYFKFFLQYMFIHNHFDYLSQQSLEHFMNKLNRN